MATAEARGFGFAVYNKVQKAQAGRIDGMLMAMKPLHEQALKNPHVMQQLPLIEINEVSTMYSWILTGMAAQNEPKNAANTAMAMCLGRQQMPDGSWTFALPREPMQSSPFTFTALSARALQAYGEKNTKEVADRLLHARQWLTTAKAQNSEDRASRLLGLKWTNTPLKDRKTAVEAIVADQRPDGGWSQLPGGASDAYATGQALYALRTAGSMSVNDPTYKKGVRFLLLTQDDDGSWFVNKRAMPANNYFDASFPHGESQYASFNGTCWAAMALMPVAKQK